MKGINLTFSALAALLIALILLVWTPLYNVMPLPVQQVAFWLGGLISVLAPLLLVVILSLWYVAWAKHKGGV